MLKTFKWIYGLGKKQERQRIEIMMLRHRGKKPNYPTNEGGWALEQYNRRMTEWVAQNQLIQDTMYPTDRKKMKIMGLEDE